MDVPEDIQAAALELAERIIPPIAKTAVAGKKDWASPLYEYVISEAARALMAERER